MKNKRTKTQSAAVPVIKPVELNVELMKKLYEFGGLFAYQVMYLDTITFTIKQSDTMTFSEEKAKKICDGLTRNGIKAEVFRHLIHFDGAWNEPKNKP